MAPKRHRPGTWRLLRWGATLGALTVLAAAVWSELSSPRVLLPDIGQRRLTLTMSSGALNIRCDRRFGLTSGVNGFDGLAGHNGVFLRWELDEERRGRRWLPGWLGPTARDPSWELVIPLWPLSIGAGALAGYCWWRRWRQRTPGLCAACGYSRLGLDPSLPCPECGALTKPAPAGSGLQGPLPPRV